MHSDSGRNKGNGIAAVLFDLDGTLIHSIEHIIGCWQHATQTCLGTPLAREQIVPTLGRPLIECFEEIAPGRSDELFAAYRAHQLVTHDTTITLVPGTHEMLGRLRDAGLRLAVVTSKSLYAAERGLNLFDLAPHFDALVTMEDSTRHKPNPDPLLVGAERLGVAPAESVYVGDALVDVLAGQAAGMKTAWVSWGAGAEEALAAKPDYVVHSMEDLVGEVVGRRTKDERRKKTTDDRTSGH